MHFGYGILTGKGQCSFFFKLNLLFSAAPVQVALDLNNFTSSRYRRILLIPLKSRYPSSNVLTDPL